MNVLITGGAGFIGSHLADELLGRGHRVRLLDSLDPQVHGAGEEPPAWLNPDAELQVGDVRDPRAVRKALEGVEGVFHLAAAVGVGQSMYEVDRYTAVNSLGTAVLMRALIEGPARRLVVASSMSVYGEGAYRRADGAAAEALPRARARLQRGEWEPLDETGGELEPVPTPETKPPRLSSVYALTKYDQERMCLVLGEAYGFPAVALRFFNVYGARQALSNPYTGVLAIFASRLLNGRRPPVFEDGRQRRDFVSVRDVVRACRLAMERAELAGEVLNIGSGRSASVSEAAQRLAAVLGRPELTPELSGRFRAGDIRHCFADIGRAREALGYRPEVTLDQGLAELAEWLATQVADDRVEVANGELDRRGLRVGASGGSGGARGERHA